jgi:uncharacterized damage-inducible protein DinB
MSATVKQAAPHAATGRKQQLLNALTREHATTLKILRAFPAGQSEFKPHERSNTARQLAWTFVMEQGLMMGALSGTLKLSGKFPPAPDSYDAIVSQFQQDFDKVTSLVESVSDDSLDETVKFFTGPGQMGDVPKLDVVWFALSDQIHHRGQLSVYLRMSGGKVPSIYGPSADEPWS